MNYYKEIKEELLNNEIYKKGKDYCKNRKDLETYYNVGRLLIDAGKQYGEKIMQKYSDRLVIEVGKKYNIRTLFRIKQFYEMVRNEKVSTLSTQLSWSHYVELLPLKNINEINYYIRICEEQNLCVRELRKKIKLKEYQRLDENTKNKLINKEEEKIEDFIKNPILIKNSEKREISEKLLKILILEDIDNFLKELGSGFCYIENEYKIKIGDRYNYIDVLLFNYIYNAFIVVELKVTELKKEHIGKIKLYMNYIDKNVKSFGQESTIGIVICKKDNMFVMEYCSDPRIFSKEYRLISSK